ncbi:MULTISPECIES: hypothetical protein [Sphingobium]|jgi:hypothetical protein|uniref:Uncharacterized protein n=2 Tax=Sphingobium TaxID=165695 RepID=A0A6P1GEV6_SPHYA|nr:MULTISPECIES: hypothetical protein [Sphingobium]QDC36669.1 hypothetical protein FIL70_04875 [Sphingobium fuliginis ATCC 27551]QHD66764.1 hypothetical protein GS397_06695 [Sphingobium yanoikuyae]QNG43846.1 hypothetical protein H3V42_18150 [Sphingobium yanoikuyae]
MIAAFDALRETGRERCRNSGSGMLPSQPAIANPSSRILEIDRDDGALLAKHNMALAILFILCSRKA